MEAIYLNDDGIRRVLDCYGSPDEGDGAVLQNLLQYAKVELRAQWVLAEESYICKDYRSEFSHLYSKVFEQFYSTTTRLHFFRGDASSPVRVANAGLSSLGYCGFAVIRPIRIGKVGRTVLEPPSTRSGRFYSICQSTFHTHLLGRKFTAVGSPFIQQDSMLMCCAHSAIWVCCRYMHRAFNFPEILPGHIVDSVSSSFSTSTRVMPTEGLSGHDIYNCFINLGYSPVMYMKPKRQDFESDQQFEEAKKHWRPSRNIYRYIESGFPVVLLVPEHAVAGIGHTFLPGRWAGHLESELFEMATISYSDEWVDGFVLQDDSASPYRVIPKTTNDKDMFERENLSHLLPPNKQKYSTLDDVNGYIVPLPEKVYVIAEHLDGILKGIFEGPLSTRLFWDTFALSEAGNTMAQEFISSWSDQANPLVLRSYISESNKYKTWLRDQTSTEIPTIIKDTLITLPMPRYIWVIEVTNAANMSKPIHSQRRILGQVVLDATGNKFAYPCLAVHLPGNLYVIDQKAKVWPTPVEIRDDHPQPMAERHAMLGL